MSISKSRSYNEISKFYFIHFTALSIREFKQNTLSLYVNTPFIISKRIPKDFRDSQVPFSSPFPNPSSLGTMQKFYRRRIFN